MRILVINGPNLNLLGTRRPEVYGTTTLAELEVDLIDFAEQRGARVVCFQSNHEGALIDALHQAIGRHDGVVANLGAYSHTSRALQDAIEAIELPTVEVHISNIYEREEWRATSFTAQACVHSIVGEGIAGYAQAVEYLLANHAP
ncbi:MAG: type II 3-dehydroquinate dehydratase [Actinobacteria bacterium]|nr:type II 3-dehydroquinate dehydratase [Actinomycetota bacterium]